MKRGLFIRRLAAVLLLVSPAVAQDEPTISFDAPTRQVNLPNGLLEISGLAVASETSVYAHNDEHAIVYEVDIETGKVIAAFALGDPTAEGDFEGVAAADGRIYLTTSDGLIYEALIGQHRRRVRFNIYDTGVHEFCEVEGLTPGPDEGSFLLLCKTARQSSLENRLVIFKWSLAERTPVSEPWLSIPYSDMMTADEMRGFRPSALEWRDVDNSIVVVSARNRVFATLDVQGGTYSTQTLSQSLHLQAEGLAVMPSGALVVADEGAGRAYGKLTVYGAQN